MPDHLTTWTAEFTVSDDLAAGAIHSDLLGCATLDMILTSLEAGRPVHEPLTAHI